jgi:hypothetical protein
MHREYRMLGLHKNNQQPGGKFIMDAIRSADPVGLLSVQKDVQDFVQAAERLLSPALRISPLTSDECDLIGEYLMSMTNAKHPWSKRLPIKYT